MTDTTPAPPESPARSADASADTVDAAVRRLAAAGPWLFVAASALSAVAFLTNPVPDPSFPWATLPASLRLPYRQPRIEHWPVTYTLGIWLYVASAPALVLTGYERFASRRGSGDADAGVGVGSASTWLVVVPAATMLAFTTYCRFFWPKLHPPTWNAPSYTFVCWAYCSSYVPAWSNAAYAVALLGVVAAALAVRGSSRARFAEAAFGVLALPLGLPALYDAYRRRRAASE
ncbi:hypothetical protein [Halobaculum sp. P14]|uniref:hypothetical protein n=1 Tax=Halobaculum sp. P14 TaxID=3421638 RepID=UPI003EBCC079